MQIAERPCRVVSPAFLLGETLDTNHHRHLR
jgi:hypothetical protein